MHGRWGRPSARVVVVAHNDESTVGDCLDALHEQRRRDVEVIVVDRSSDDRTTDVAIHHPAVDAVVVTGPSAPLLSVLEAASIFTTTHLLLVVPADRRPGPRWIERGLALLEHHEVVLDGDGPGVLAVDLDAVRHLDAFGSEDPAEVRRRLAAAGRCFIPSPSDFAVGPARSEAPAVGAPPVARAPEGLRPAMTGRISVVVCTRDRAAPLRRCLASLAALDDDDHEVVIVDNHEAPAVEPTTCERWRVVHEPRQGLDIARNRGLAEATGTVVAYVDDDCEVDPNWLTALRAAFADPAVQAVTGRVRPASLRRPSERHFEVHFGFDRGTRPARFTIHDLRPWFPLWGGVCGTGCNMAFRTDALRAAGGFDELLDMGTSIGGGGDLDVYTRLVESGAVIAYEPTALVWHHHRPDARSARRQFVGYGTSIGALLTKAVVERPGLRREAWRFGRFRLRHSLHLARIAARGTYPVPAHLVVLEMYGVLRGPWRYLRARASRPATR
jgi:glycosyltransferase involved in cell wall biosynthesis